MSITYTEQHTDPDIKRHDWPSGPWDSEPDKLVWIDEATGLDCMIHRNSSGALCGYVGVPPSHPWHGVGYWEPVDASDDDWVFAHERSPDAQVDVHGGLTYASACQGNLCHTPQPGRPTDVWWFGFDCAHSGDETPLLRKYGPAVHYEVYRDVAYVTGQVERLASQLEAVTS